MVDGLDGSGKGVVMRTLTRWAKDKGLKTLDLCRFWRQQEGYPDVNGFGAVISAEPTYTGWGKNIREKLIRTGEAGSDQKIAEAFSKDRKELYEKVILPALRGDKYVFQDRGVVTSLVYQPLMEGNTKKSVMGLAGNRFCLAHPPGLLIITLVNPEEGIRRLGNRDKKDKAIFENVEFQKKVKKVYEGKWLRNLFEKRGTKVVFLHTDPPMAEKDTEMQTLRMINTYFNSC